MGQSVHETTVTIRGTSYQLRTDVDRDRLKSLATYVDDMMNVMDPKHSVPPAKLSVLASLSLAGELFDAREGRSENDVALRERVARMHSLLDKALEEA